MVASVFSMSFRVMTRVRTGVLANSFGLRVPVTTTCSRSMVRLSVSAGRAALAVMWNKRRDKKMYVRWNMSVILM